MDCGRKDPSGSRRGCCILCSKEAAWDVLISFFFTKIPHTPSAPAVCQVHNRCWAFRPEADLVPPSRRSRPGHVNKKAQSSVRIVALMESASVYRIAC